MKELKNYTTRYAKTMYWHCCIDQYKKIDVSSRSGPLLKLRIKGVNEKYDKTIILFSHQGKRDFFLSLQGKKLNIISFLAMLLIFVAVLSCKEGDN